MALRRKLLLWAVGVGIFACGMLAGWFFCAYVQASRNIIPVRFSQPQYPLINQILYFDTPQNFAYPKYASLHDALTAYSNQATAQGRATEVSVYFRDLNSSEWVGVNETEQFDPASMLKVATLLATLHQSEKDSTVLSDTVTVPASFTIPVNPQDYYPPANPVTSGHTYTVPDLLQRLIVQSDNGANTILTLYLGDTILQGTYSALSIPTTADTSGITAQQYSHLFRVLYNATYLDAVDSEKALELLSQTDFTKGLVAGVPAGTRVAHKFGEATVATAGAIHELHDCGIVYYPSHPYFLCVMTRGSDFPTLQTVIADISRITWQQVSNISK